MGSFGKMTLVNEPSLEVAAEVQHCCSESTGKLVSEQRDCVVIDSNGDCAGKQGEDENTGCKKSGDIDYIVGMKGEVLMVGSGMMELIGGEWCANSVHLKKNWGEKADATCSKELTDMCSDGVVCVENNQGELMGDSGLKELTSNKNDDFVVCCLEDQGESVNDSDFSIGNQGEKVDDTFPKESRGTTYGDSTVCSNGNQSENLDGAGLNRLIGDICGDTVVCLNDKQGASFNCSVPKELMGHSDSSGYSNEIQCENIYSGSIELKGDRIGDHGVCLNENQGNVNVHDSKTDMCSKILTSCCAETISILQRTGDSLGSCNCHNQKDPSSSDILLESSTIPMEIRSIDDLCIELLASRISLHTQQNEKTNNVSCPSEDVAEVSEGSNVPAGTKVEISSEIRNAKGKACNLNRDSLEQGANCLSDKSISLSCQPIDVLENGLAGNLDAPDPFRKEASAAISASSSIDCSGQRENERKDIVKVDCVAETKKRPTTSSSSRRSRQKSKSSQKAPAKRGGRNCSSRKLQLPLESIEFLFKASRRKRSCSSKPARSSTWGLLNNITKFLEPCPDLLCNGVQNQEPFKDKGSRKRSKHQAGQNKKEPSGLNNTSTSCLRLKIKLGKDVAPSNLNTLVAEVVDPSVSVGTFGKYGKKNVVEDKAGDLGSEMQFHSKEDQEMVKTCSDAFVTEVKLANKVVGSAEKLVKIAEYAADNSLVSQSDAVGEASQEETENKCMDPGTSPDSEVINTIPDTQVGLIHQEESDDMVFNTSGALASPGGVKTSKGSKRGKKKDNHRSTGAVSIGKAKSSKSHRGRQKTVDNGIVCCKALTTSPAADASRENGLGITKNAIGSMDNACFSPDVPDAKSTKLVSFSNHKRNQLSKSSKSQGVSRGKSRISDSARNTKGTKSVSKSKVKEIGFNEEIVARVAKSPVPVGAAGNHISDDNEDSNTGNNIVPADVVNGDLVPDGIMQQHTQPDSAWVRCDDCHKWRRIPVSLVKSIDVAYRWVCGYNVDKAFADCSIPQEKSNADINAELGISDAEEDGCDGFSNKELEKGIENKCMTASAPSHFWRINSNQFLHRGLKTQTIDEIMVCQCKRPPDGKLGCGDECLNRMLNIECVKGTCPCGDLCSNQQFQKRKYAKIKWDRFGKKGFGLRMQENISAGHFLIEYVGEVLDMQAYEARQEEYASRGQRHFYFMTLNGSEVIDAYVKGNLGRFINHSCDPNCRTEKWMVNGEICIGLFALRDIKKGEEVTFDYNYVRVFGAAAKKCHCGSPHCRGYIGGDPLSAEVIVHDDSDEESPEPMMFEDGETWTSSKAVISRSNSFDGSAMQSVESVITHGVGKFENVKKAKDSVSRSATSELNSSVQTETIQLDILPDEALPVAVPSEAVQADCNEEQKAINKISCSIQKLDASLNISDNKLSSDIIDAYNKSKSDTSEVKKFPAKSRTLMKTSHSSGSAKKGKISSNSLHGNKVQITSNKSQVPTVKPRKFSENSSTGRFETVEEKLNELLDSEGGITKRKDASKGYLKLLLLTATSGDGGSGEAIQRNRELSMILDALLKTKSGHVLTDIINKNGLQMLHNILKKYRRDFKKIPILRKLLKVLEYLAGRGILTQEHINGGPYCAGRESFRDSILSFTEHYDKQVHQIARNFRDKWIRKPVRKHGYRDKDEGRMEFHRVSASHSHWRDQAIRSSEAINCVTQSLAGTTSTDTSTREGSSLSSAGVSQANGARIHKRKSRWDQPADPEKIDSRSPKKLKCSTLSPLGQAASDHTEKMNSGDNKCHVNFCKGEATNIDNGNQSFQQDAPPGFSPLNTSLVSPAAPSTATGFPQPKVCLSKFPDVVVAHPKKRFISRLPVSYGIPLPFLQQFGSPQDESPETWRIAPGMPFHPFPPLPPCPPDKKNTQPVSSANSTGTSVDAKEGQQDLSQ
ncbi:histone-lysine N-methyltransferase ASHH2-like [Hibiscus syriacus]|uniref:histone-lysine N-methyltransferase ASHH2-like n=1 Tax=Hibiscus syriacus TaxID=106335 RepID=UPI001924B2FA|nr:histone-lysine N-methyltransferase ASHH2-like [Hibiscus syriacus]